MMYERRWYGHGGGTLDAFLVLPNRGCVGIGGAPHRVIPTVSLAAGDVAEPTRAEAWLRPGWS